MPNKGNTALGTSDEVFEVDAGATSNSPIYAGALAALTAIFYCIMG